MTKQAKRTDADWVEVDLATLPETEATLFATYKAQYRAAKAAREQFEESMNRAAPEGSRMIFGYNFGKLSVAIVEDDRKPKATGKQAVSLQAYLAQRAASGQQA